MANARPLAEAGAAVVIENSQLSGARLTAALSSLLDDPGKLAAMAQAARRLQRPRAAEDIAQLLLDNHYEYNKRTNGSLYRDRWGVNERPGLDLRRPRGPGYRI